MNGITRVLDGITLRTYQSYGGTRPVIAAHPGCYEFRITVSVTKTDEQSKLRRSRSTARAQWTAAARTCERADPFRKERKGHCVSATTGNGVIAIGARPPQSSWQAESKKMSPGDSVRDYLLRVLYLWCVRIYMSDVYAESEQQK